MQKAEAFEHPRLPAAVVDVLERLEPLVAFSCIGRERRHHELESILAIGILDARQLRLQDLAPAINLADGKLQRERGVVGFCQRKAGDVLLLLPHLAQPRHRWRCHRHIAQRAEPRRLLARCARRAKAFPQQRLESRGTGRALRLREESPPRVRRVAQHARCHLLIGFARQRAERKIEERIRRDLAVEHRIPQRDPRASARQRIADLGQIRRQVSKRRFVEHEVAVRPSVAIGKHVARRRPAFRLGHFGLAAGQFNLDDLFGRVAANRHAELLRPHAIAIPGGMQVALTERQLRDGAVSDFEDGFDGRAPRLVDPHAAPLLQIHRRARVEHRDQICPRRIAERVRREVLAQAIAEIVVAKQRFEVAHDDRRLLVDDRAVHLSRFAQVVEHLANRVRARRAIDLVGSRVVRQQEPQLVVHRGKGGVHDLRRHEVGEHFLHPHVVEPAHGDEIAKPHVRGFVGDHRRAAELLVLRRGLIEQQA